MEKVILVDKNDNELGTMEKLEAHRKSVLHRAISVFIVNSKGEWLLQKRTSSKYHSGGLWTNSCCSHPYPGEKNIQAANRRLMEEMGLSAELREIFHFVYREKLDNGYSEHELDHVFMGISDDKPDANISEVENWKFISFAELENDINCNPEKYTVWFRKLYTRVNTYLNPRESFRSTD